MEFVLRSCSGHVTSISTGTVPIAKILSVKNVRAWVSMVSYLKNLIKMKILKRK